MLPLRLLLLTGSSVRVGSMRLRVDNGGGRDGREVEAASYCSKREDIAWPRKSVRCARVMSKCSHVMMYTW